MATRKTVTGKALRTKSANGARYVVTKRVGTDEVAFYRRGDIVRGTIDPEGNLWVTAHVSVKGEALAPRGAGSTINKGWFRGYTTGAR